MTTFINNPTNFDRDENKLKNMQNQILSVLEKVKKFIGNIFRFNRKTESFKLLQTLNELQSLFNSVEIMLSELELYKNEFFLFSLINMMFESIVDDIKLIDYFSLVEGSFIEFFNIFKLKNNISNDDYYSQLDEIKPIILSNYNEFIINAFDIPSEKDIDKVKGVVSFKFMEEI